MKKLLFIIVLFASCKVEKSYKFKPGDTAKIRNVSFLILDYNKTRPGFYYKAKDLKRGFYVEYFPQKGLKNVKSVTQQNKQLANKNF